MEYCFNYEVLKRYIRDSVFTTKDICGLVGVPETTFYYQVRNNRLLLSTIFQVANILCLTDEELLKMFRK